MPYFYDCGGGGGGDPLFSESGVAKYRDGQGTTDPNVNKTILTFTVTPIGLEVFGRIVVHCGVSGIWSLDDGSSIIASGRTQSGNPESIFEWLPRRVVAGGTTLSLKFLATAGPSTDVYWHVMSREL